MSRTRMRLGALATAGVLTLGLAACAGDEESATTPTTPASTVDEAGGTADDADVETGTTDVQTATADEETEDAAATADAGEGEEIPVSEFLEMLQEPGEDTLSRYTLTMNMDMDGQESEMDGAVDLSGESPKMRITMVMPDLGTVELIYVDNEAYMAIPGLTPEGTYLVAPPEMLGDQAELDELDVSAQWEVWEEGAQEVLFLGEEDVDGTEMRRYQVTVDPEAAAAAVADDDAAATSLDLEGLVVYDVWLDDDNLMRKMAFDVDGEMVEMWLDNWGEDPGIEAPDPDQVTQMEDLGTGSG